MAEFPSLLVRFRSLPKGQERFLEGLVHRTFWLGQHKGLIGIKEFDATTVEEVEEMPDKSNAIENGDFRPVRLVVNLCCVLAHFIIDSFRRDENVVVDSGGTPDDFLQSAVNVVMGDPLRLHFIDRHYMLVIYEADLNISQRAALFIG